MRIVVFLFLALLVIIACNSPEKNNQKVIVCGNVAEVSNAEIYFNVYGDSKKDTVAIDRKGNFKIEKDLKNPAFAYLYCDGKRIDLFMKPGDSIFIKGNLENLTDSLQFSGEGYLASKTLHTARIFNNTQNPKYDSLYSLPPDVFHQLLSNNLQKVLQLIKSELKEDTSNYQLLAENQCYEYYTFYLNYKNYHEYFGSDPKNTQIPGDFYETPLLKEKLADRHIQLPKFEEYLSAYIVMNEITTEGDTSYFISQRIAKIDSLFKGKIREFAVYQSLIEGFKYYYDKRIHPLWKQIQPSFSETKFIAEINELEQKWEKLQPGNPAPGFVFEDLKGKKYALSDFKDKWIYIDVWATWCGPCKQESPYFEKLAEKFKNQPIVFLSISVDDSRSAWERYIYAKKSSAIHLYAGGWKDITDKYFINAIPRFIIIDNKGLIYSPDAERPSGKAEKLFNEIFAAQKSV